MLLADLLLPNYNRSSALGLSRQYNELISAAFDDYVDFINFHYAAGRDDTDFWRDYQKDESLTERNRWRREKWKYSFPTREDFAPQRTLRVGLTVGLVVWAPMLCAFGMLSQENAQRLLSGSKALSITHENVQQYIQIRQLITANALTHEQTLRYLKGMN